MVFLIFLGCPFLSSGNMHSPISYQGRVLAGQLYDILSRQRVAHRKWLSYEYARLQMMQQH